MYLVAEKNILILCADKPSRSLEGNQWCRKNAMIFLSREEYPQFSGLTFEDEPVKVQIFPDGTVSGFYQASPCPFCKINKNRNN